MSETWGGDVDTDIARLDRLTREASAEQGLAFCADFIKNHPERGEGFFYAGLLNHHMGQLGQAMEMMSRAHELAPDVREFALALSSMHAKSNHLNDALYYAKVGAANESSVFLDAALTDELRDFIASTLSADPQKHYVQAMISYNLRDFSAVVRECEQELKLNNRFAPSYALIGKALLQLGHFERAVMAFRAVLDLDEGQSDDDILTGLAECYLRLGLPQDALAALAEILGRTNVTVETLGAVAKLLAYVPDGEWADVRAFCKTWNKRLLDGQERYFPVSSPPDERIRVGVLTDKAYQCLEGRALEVFAKRYDRALFDCFLYVQNVGHDAVTHGFSGTMTGMRNVYEIDDKTLALIVQRDEIDVLIDMCGYGQGQRLNIVAHRPARAHVSWMASPALDGQPGIDWYWRDVQDGSATGDPLKRVPLALEALPGFGPVTALPAHESGFVSFGARLDLSYITPEVAVMWGELLCKVDGARLRLGLVEDISQAMVDRLAALLEPKGVLDRVILHTPGEDEDNERGNFFKDVDIFLGQPTADAVEDFIDALWCGVPCLSIPSDRQVFVSGRDIVTLCGDARWNAADGDVFVSFGTELAANLDELAAHRAGLRERVQASSLMDGKAFADQVQGMLIGVAKWSREQGEDV